MCIRDSFRCEVTHNIRVRGGVAVFVNNTYPARCMLLTTPLQAVAKSLLQPITTTICCVYLADSAWRAEDLQELVEQLLSPLHLVGVFNAHSQTLGLSYDEQRWIKTCSSIAKQHACLFKYRSVHTF